MPENEIDVGVAAWMRETKWCDICKSSTCDANFLIIEDNKKSFAIEQWKLCNWVREILQLDNVNCAIVKDNASWMSGKELNVDKGCYGQQSQICDYTTE